MTSKRRRSASVLPDWFNRLKKEGLGSKYEAAMREWAEAQSPGTSRDEPDWDDPSTREIAADSALTLRKEDALYRPVVDVFESAGLNPKNPFHWRILLDFLCWAHSRPQRKRGRTRKWSKRYSQLTLDFASVRKEKPTIRNVQVCRILKKRHPERYGRPNESPSAERIAKEVKRSRDPKFNPALGTTLDAVLRLVRLDYEEQGLEWNADTEARKSKEWVEYLNKLVQRSGHPVAKTPS